MFSGSVSVGVFRLLCPSFRPSVILRLCPLSALGPLLGLSSFLTFCFSFVILLRLVSFSFHVFSHILKLKTSPSFQLLPLPVWAGDVLLLFLLHTL